MELDDGSRPVRHTCCCLRSFLNQFSVEFGMLNCNLYTVNHILLLIFFLVTTMLKKLEKQIPVVLPDYTSALAPVAETEVIIYALDESGNLLRATGPAHMPGQRKPEPPWQFMTPR